MKNNPEPDIVYQIWGPVNPLQYHFDLWQASKTGQMGIDFYSTVCEIWGAKFDRRPFRVSRGIDASPLNPRGTLYYLRYMSDRNKASVEHVTSTYSSSSEFIDIDLPSGQIEMQPQLRTLIAPRRFITLDEPNTWYSPQAILSSSQLKGWKLIKVAPRMTNLPTIDLPHLQGAVQHSLSLTSVSISGGYLYILMSISNPSATYYGNMNIHPKPDNRMFVYTINGELVRELQLASYVSDVLCPLQTLLQKVPNGHGNIAAYYTSLIVIRPAQGKKPAIFAAGIRYYDDNGLFVANRNIYFAWDYASDNIIEYSGPNASGSKSGDLDIIANALHDLDRNISYVFIRFGDIYEANVYCFDQYDNWNYMDVGMDMPGSSVLDVNGRLWYSSLNKSKSSISMMLKVYDPVSGNISVKQRLKEAMQIGNIHANPRA